MTQKPEGKYLVIYNDRAVYPASERFETEAQAREAVARRPGQIIETQIIDGQEVGRYLQEPN